MGYKVAHYPQQRCVANIRDIALQFASCLTRGQVRIHKRRLSRGDSMFGNLKCTLLTGAMVAALTAGMTSAFAQSGGAGRKAEDAYKNIQVLKGVPADQVIPAMQFFTASL